MTRGKKKYNFQKQGEQQGERNELCMQKSESLIKTTTWVQKRAGANWKSPGHLGEKGQKEELTKEKYYPHALGRNRNWQFCVTLEVVVCALLECFCSYSCFAHAYIQVLAYGFVWERERERMVCCLYPVSILFVSCIDVAMPYVACL